MPIKLKRSAVADKVPTTDQLELGELAVNTPTGRLFTKTDNGTPAIVEFSRVGHDHDTANFTGGTLDGVTIGGTTPGPVAATTLSASGTLTGFVGRLLNVQIFDTPGAATYTPTAGTKIALVRATSGGGAGGGADSDVTDPTTGDCGHGGGGAGGTPFEGLKDVSAESYSAALAVGAGGIPASQADGGAGGDTTWDDGTDTFTLPGGNGGQSFADSGGISYSVGGIGGAGTFSAGWTCTLGVCAGADAGDGFGIPRNAGVATAASKGGQGGASIFGGSRRGPRINAQGVSTAGYDGRAPGEGGSGAAALGTNAPVAGGNGAPGMIVVFEYSA